MSFVRQLAVTFLGAVALCAQFDVASVKPSAPGAPEEVNIGVHIDGARITCNNLSLLHYARLAWRMKDYQIIAPEWMSAQRYDIAATLPPGATQDQVPEMIRALLADRFQMKVHNETREFPVYALIAGKGPLKIRESPADPENETPVKTPVSVTGGGSRNGISINLGGGAYYAFADNKLDARKLTMPAFAEILARFADRPVVDMTGLKGRWDILLNFTEEDYDAMLIRAAINAGVTIPPSARQKMETAPGDSISAAIREVGLKLERRKAPLDVLVIDHAEKTPTEN